MISVSSWRISDHDGGSFHKQFRARVLNLAPPNRSKQNHILGSKRRESLHGICFYRSLYGKLSVFTNFKTARLTVYSLKELAQAIKAKLAGDPGLMIARARSFELAEEGDVTLASDPAYRARIDETKATAIIVDSVVDESKRNFLVAGNPKLAFARAISFIHASP